MPKRLMALLMLTMANFAGGPGVFQEPKLRATLKGHSGRVCSVGICPDCTLLASANSDGTVKLCDILVIKKLAP